MSTTPPTDHARRTRDDGFAVLVVMAGMTVLMLVLTLVLTYSTQTLRTIRDARDWNQALMAADAGVSDYLARLNADDNYWLTSPDCTNTAMRAPQANGACGWGASTAVGWLPVPGGDGADFHYDVNTSATAVSGTIQLTVTGRDQGETRTVQVRLRRGGFGEFLYYTVYETLDPANEAQFGTNNTTAQTRCSKYYWAGRSSWSGNPCVDINFITGDVIDGPLHSNDSILMSGRPTFNGTVSTSLPSCKPVNGVNPAASSCYRAASGGATPVFNKGITYRAEITMPDSIGDLRQYVASSQPTPGCLFTGPTRIKLIDDSGPVSKMKVWSPWTRGTLNPGCGTPPLDGDLLTIPNNNIVIVQDVPSTQTKDASNTTVPTGSCAAGWIGDGLPLAGTTSTGDFAQTLSESSCRYGTLYLEGVLEGRLTMAADNNILITGNLTYKGGRTGTDALGLIATNSVKIYHPAKCTTYSSGKCTAGTNLNRPVGSTFQDPQVNAAILTLQHSFTVQQYQLGSPLGTLNLFGTIAQRYRGPVGTGSISTGYLKHYVYDTRMRFAPPPYFLDPVRSAWDVKTYGELSPRYGSG
ncbi:hypothetical protein [Nocardioides mangrovi]|uniref:DUF4900 domain-containing protein n=1 Tax=Nocardioides mangrovi TaxID=2874580 RepID=A0ABS7UIF2_9ACTN|nr:hypothetical protein [Nocardioides mangrovi]MBZ5740020.1 hypothetical protein [Nocardioides mangrovi]MBZ5740809.1 hypothetical protein [Nocardioides mangrovi]